MAEETLYTFDIKRLSILDENGKADGPVPMDEALIKRAYELMLISRVFDERALNLQREGRIGTYASVLGQEASQMGSALAIKKEDWVFPSFREMGVYIALGYPMSMLYQYWSGDERGMKTPEGLNIFPLCIPVGTQIPHAVGAAMAAKYKNENIAVFAYFGDGGTSKGDFHEGLNFGGVFRLPIVFICQNNQWAISVPREKQTASQTLAQKAVSYGFEGVQVDGNDIFAVYKATEAAAQKARSGGGPTFIECHTYRVSDHTTADDASRYRRHEETEAWRQKDPIKRLRRYMENNGLHKETDDKEIIKKASALVEEAVKIAESVPAQTFEDLFGHTYKTIPHRLKKEMEKR